MSIRQFPFMAFAVILYFVLVSLFKLPLNQDLMSIPMPSGVRLVLTVSDILIILATIFSFVELIGSTSASATAILNHGLQLIVFLAALLLLLLLPTFATGCFLVITMMTLINTVAGYSISILRARRDFTVGPTL